MNTALHEIGAQLLSPLLLSLEDSDKLIRIGQLLPSSWQIPLIHIEFPLYLDQITADFSFYIDLSTCSASSFLESSLPLELRQSHTWKLLSDFMSHAIATGFFAERQIQGVWLEFDVCEKGVWPPDPNLLFVTRSLRNELVLSTIEKVTSFVCTKKQPLQTLVKLQNCSDRDWKIHFLGFMLGRSVPPIRIGLMRARFDPRQVQEALKLLGYMHPIKELTSLIKKLKNFPGIIFLSFDFDDPIGDRIGLECQPIYLDFAAREVFWWEFLFFLQKENMMSNEKVERFLPFTCEINHVKFVFAPQQPIRAKLYVGLRAERFPG